MINRSEVKSVRGLFVGLVTLDFVYLAPSPPTNNQKIVASDYVVAAGGPATNAAVTFSYLGNQATLLGIVGSHPITQLVRADLATYGVAIADLAPSQTEPPPVSSIIVSQETGERAVVSINAVKNQVTPEFIPNNILQGVDIVLIDGHQMLVGEAIAQLAKANNIPVVVDGGSWKPGFEKVLSFADYIICSANFRPPNCHNMEEVFAYLSQIEIPHIAITQGEQPIQFLDEGKIKSLEISQIKPIDTLGAGDIFHGAFCHYILQHNFIEALGAAAKIAARSCQAFGSRQWMQTGRN
ncbi:MAG: Sulfofructose kinase [Chroococcidiopsis cubana SAG 39.79]|uniref:Kinase n=1 Tax=Chroococcidiopsis cubana SAG 39.79 TaxID=388085 RepID=A0AB37UIN9_9CYAN|nr:sugar kinase [Chroococcidiopsis cubana]MDZ4872341.1 Sulfofructose kinase [Chroococcidiopsis cubana SAG 39.79]PSB63832.1 ribokinase [Chroococcidiopsis cubana CCALA 043]RUT11272.1 kinase [Chroococcidiopsis cubana SAG 39.79]